MKIRITLIEEMLGTKAANPDVFGDWIAGKHPSGTPARDELENAEHLEIAGTTIFHRQDNRPGIYDYQVKGFFKDACNACNRMDKEFTNGLAKLPAYKTKIDGCIFVSPRFITFEMPKGREIGVCERPIRVETAQGPRVAVVRSEAVPIGTVLEFDVAILSKELQAYVTLWMGYGKLRGLGQWRNSGKGRFNWEEI